MKYEGRAYGLGLNFARKEFDQTDRLPLTKFMMREITAKISSR